jgi:hypothetical protein
MENAGIFYGHLEFCTVIWYILWLFGYVVVIWYIFPRFGILYQEKSGNTGRNFDSSAPSLPGGDGVARNGESRRRSPLKRRLRPGFLRVRPGGSVQPPASVAKSPSGLCCRVARW